MIVAPLLIDFTNVLLSFYYVYYASNLMITHLHFTNYSCLTTDLYTFTIINTMLTNFYVTRRRRHQRLTNY